LFHESGLKVINASSSIANISADILIEEFHCRSGRMGYQGVQREESEKTQMNAASQAPQLIHSLQESKGSHANRDMNREAANAKIVAVHSSPKR
jgi:hypothetical protein